MTLAVSDELRRIFTQVRHLDDDITLEPASLTSASAAQLRTTATNHGLGETATVSERIVWRGDWGSRAAAVTLNPWTGTITAHALLYPLGSITTAAGPVPWQTVEAMVLAARHDHRALAAAVPWPLRELCGAPCRILEPYAADPNLPRLPGLQAPTHEPGLPAATGPARPTHQRGLGL
jgi:hypothetical protein